MIMYDLLYDLDIKEVLGRLPREIVDVRNQRLKCAIDLHETCVPPRSRSFLRGLAACGKGHWKRISRDYVKGRTPQQVASHAQKYFNRQNAELQNKKRSSIHDINTLDHLHGQLPVTGADSQAENVHADYMWGNIYAGNQMESAYPEREIIDAYAAPIAMDDTFYLGNQRSAAENQNLMGDAGYPDHQTNNANNDHYGFKT